MPVQVYQPVYVWAKTKDRNQIALFLDGRQVGNYSYRHRQFWVLFGNDQWSIGDLPVSAPQEVSVAPVPPIRFVGWVP